jgi:glycerol-3-phosphate acyltransferase PlsY
MLWILAGTIVSYLIGSIPTAYIFGRLLKGIDIRTQGSGNIGATNALRVLGKGPGITVLVLDILKGMLPVLIIGGYVLRRTGFAPELALIPIGVGAICGHIWTVFLNFNGGKGVATTLGALIGLAFSVPGLNAVLGLVVLTWLAVFLVSRVVSLASIIAALALPALMFVFHQSTALLCTGGVLTAFTLYRHKGNVKRLLEGKEKKLSFGKPQPTK